MKTKIVNYPDLVAARDRHPSDTSFSHASFNHFDELKEIANGKKYYIHTFILLAAKQTSETKKQCEACLKALATSKQIKQMMPM